MMKPVESIALIVKFKFKTSMLKSSSCDYSDAYILVNGTVTVTELAASRGNINIQVVFKNCAPFIDCTSKIDSIQIDNVKEIDVVMAMYNLIECHDNKRIRKFMAILKK